MNEHYINAFLDENIAVYMLGDMKFATIPWLRFYNDNKIWNKAELMH